MDKTSKAFFFLSLSFSLVRPPSLSPSESVARAVFVNGAVRYCWSRPSRAADVLRLCVHVCVSRSFSVRIESCSSAWLLSALLSICVGSLSMLLVATPVGQGRTVEQCRQSLCARWRQPPHLRGNVSSKCSCACRTTSCGAGCSRRCRPRRGAGVGHGAWATLRLTTQVSPLVCGEVSQRGCQSWRPSGKGVKQEASARGSMNGAPAASGTSDASAPSATAATNDKAS